MQRFRYLCLVRVISCIGIVVLHTYYVYVSYFPATALDKTISYVVRNAMMWAVPCFIMVTGALLLDPARSLSIKKLFSKYISRAALAIVIFTLIFYLFDMVLNHQSPRLSDVTAFLLKVYTDGSWTHMWYLYMLVGLYLLMPAYRKVAEGSSDAEFRYLLIVATVFMLILPNLDTLFGIKTGFYIAVYTVYPFYLFLGYALHKEIVRIPLLMSFLMMAVGLAALGALTAYQVSSGNEIAKKLLSNYSFVVTAVAATGVFSMIRSLMNKPEVVAIPAAAAEVGMAVTTGEAITEGMADETAAAEAAPVEKPKDTLLNLIDKRSFGIYLLHFMVLKFAVMVLRWNPYTAGGNLMLILVTAAVFVVSFGLTFLLRLIPGMKKVL